VVGLENMVIDNNEDYAALIWENKECIVELEGKIGE